MPEALELIHMNHINAMVEDFDATIELLDNVYGAQFNLDLPGAHWHACLVTIGGVMFEVFAPTEYLLNARMGPHYVGVEYQVPNVEEARDEVTARGMRVVRELGSAFHMHPADGLGVGWEIFDRSFQDPDNPPVPYVEPLKSPDYWSDVHPLGYLGLKRYSVVVSDMKAALDFADGFLGARVLYETDRPAVAARAVGIALGDTVAEFLVPIGPGEVERFHARYGDGIRSTVFAVRSLDRARDFFNERGVEVHPGDASDSFAVPPRHSGGLLFEFSE